MVYKVQYYKHHDGLFWKNIKDYLARHKNYTNLQINGCSVYTDVHFYNSACMAEKPSTFTHAL